MTIPPDEYVAVYRPREDGDHDFVACFCRSSMPQMTPADSMHDMIEPIVETIADEGEEARLIGGPDPNFPSVLTDGPAERPTIVTVDASSLFRVIEYLYRDEQKNYEEGAAPIHHIFLDVQRLNHQFRNQTEMSPEPPNA